MTQIPTIAAIRFGYGLGRHTAPPSAASLLSGLARANAITKQYPVIPSATVLGKLQKSQQARQAVKDAKPNSAAREKAARLDLQQTSALGILHGTARILDTKSAFFERLNWFWADHFTAVGKNMQARAFGPAYIDEAIRPHITGRFADMLKAVMTHPFMLVYLDQASSAGPNSAIGKRRNRGLNENLAREVLELHSLGLDAGYSQNDVRQLAELLTGLSFSRNKGFVFNARMSEPGGKTIMGKEYGGKKNDLNDIYQALDYLAMHPETAHHLARKLAVHFVSDRPDKGLINHMAQAYLDADGDLMALYTAMLGHPAAWVPLGGKAKQPFDFVTTALIALNVSGAEFLALGIKDQRRLIYQPLVEMGQPFMQALGPDGWPEAAEEWITPQGLAARIAWSVGVSQFVGERVRDPQAFLSTTLADAAGEKLTRSVAQTNSVQDGVALVLASAEFNRR